MTSDTGVMLHEFLRSPLQVGAVAPSSRRLAAAVTAPVPEAGDPVVVELGPGTGAFTGMIQELLGGRGHHVAVEINPRLADSLRRRFPRVEVLTADASRLPRLLAECGHGTADVVISGLPWVSLPGHVQHETLCAVRDVLPVDGAFTTFGYVHAMRLAPARRFRRMLGVNFEEVVAGRTVWGNLPPAFVYHSRRPRDIKPIRRLYGPEGHGCTCVATGGTGHC
ncbi:methyltransferase domain-containing protein [Streptomyces sp. BE308]|uniref:class I SAM-dependent methyltransferase n=1 Tax=unclassified Streptomyces TaxID=2593676 RepID=UPI000D1B529B|nr:MULTISPECIES: methyltransferase domain-containing protein [unclassified Streptomyces]MEE1790664.1 methyltransferase domain-containing protein [Streptomyces sp. BE308]